MDEKKQGQKCLINGNAFFQQIFPMAEFRSEYLNWRPIRFKSRLMWRRRIKKNKKKSLKKKILRNMTNAEVTLCGFEGPEKLFEIWFTKPSVAYYESFKNQGLSGEPDLDMEHLSLPGEGLRKITKAEWDVVLTKVGCQVLSTLENEYGDAYLLSESSMFVFSHRLTLKTCGTTKLLGAVPLILQLAKERCDLHSVEAVFYSRKAFFFPEKQIFPHNAWDNEVL
jgi:hypothetical protein